MGVGRERVLMVEVCKEEPLPAYDKISGIVITGSHDMITDRSEWSERTAAWLPDAIERKIPTLGICYGHHLLAYALGGEVGDNPNGKEFGTIEVTLSPEADGIQLFKGLPNPVKFHACHTQSVLRLPPKAHRLASSDLDSNHAFMVGDCAWGIQFHPEFNVRILVEYIKEYRKALMDEGKDPERLIRQSEETPHGGLFLKSFTRIIEAGEA